LEGKENIEGPHLKRGSLKEGGLAHKIHAIEIGLELKAQIMNKFKDYLLQETEKYMTSNYLFRKNSL